jgi:hypothetical protein
MISKAIGTKARMSALVIGQPPAKLTTFAATQKPPP